MKKKFKISFLKCWKWFATKKIYLLIYFPQLIGIQNFKKISFLLYKWKNENEINIWQEDVRMVKVLQYAYKTYYCNLSPYVKVRSKRIKVKTLRRDSKFDLVLKVKFCTLKIWKEMLNNIIYVSFSNGKLYLLSTTFKTKGLVCIN